MNKSLVLSTESLNSYGFWLPISGAILELFRKNPVMFYDHNKWRKPIGHWENIRIEDAKLIADPNFDEKDPEAAEVKRKFDRGDIRGASIGFEILETSEEPAMLKQGQRRPTVTKYKVIEASITATPSNDDCLSLSRGSVTLTNATDEQISLILPTIPIKTLKHMDKIAIDLGLAANASEDQILDKIQELKSTGKNYAVLKAYVSKDSEGIDEDAKKMFDRLIENDPENALSVLSLAKRVADPNKETSEPKKQLSVSEILEKLQKGTNSNKSDELDKESFDYLQRNNPEKLMQLKRSDPAEFEKLQNAYLQNKKQRG